ncbi:hypothetical protein SPRG_11554 [Saprolegnia parasitica CBS 223.65]|uniref:Uncharacterized protein n=1 Tax=Saprolegnia parasitica (strain CBS 223.65) TaxID=695850 RepID=A0A067C105_SAPPC|nr:hypothetical protein SPRG_11554 [Saprolegnia parasitica CBS 223.65]KDO22795.1 hypothetical protein SPRG_11554 [Saprolegnia parasitica CBS 223.65]|eukprot:XP_012206469.1 hypothetical protein SPRG_11554 [Saprolegnia parasitica CBS 223.65]
MNTINPTDNECQYTYKPCTNPRSRKKNGSLHSFCEYHRQKANALQKAHDARKRLREADAARGIAASRPAPIEETRTIATSASFGVDDMRFMSEWLLDANNVDADDYLDGTSPLTTEDYAILCDIFRGP